MKYWETKEGTEIPYKKLEDSHLLNILKWIKRKSKEGMIECGGQYLGEGEHDFWIDELDEHEILEKYDYKGLLREARKRGLSIPCARQGSKEK